MITNALMNSRSVRLITTNVNEVKSNPALDYIHAYQQKPQGG